MIQRPQTLFLFVSALLGVALLFVPIGHVTTASATHGIFLVPFPDAEISGTAGHMAAIALNFVGITLAFVSVFLYNKRPLQKKICYGLMVLWLIVALMMAFCPFVSESTQVLASESNLSGPIIGGLGAAAAFMAARYIQKDINLLRNADRIR